MGAAVRTTEPVPNEGVGQGDRRSRLQQLSTYMRTSCGGGVLGLCEARTCAHVRAGQIAQQWGGTLQVQGFRVAGGVRSQGRGAVCEQFHGAAVESAPLGASPCSDVRSTWQRRVAMHCHVA